MDWGNINAFVLAPHLDDEAIGCGGIVQRITSHGGNVFVVYGSHIYSSHRKLQKSSEYREYSGRDRLEEMWNAHQILGIGDGVDRNYTILYSGEDYHHKLDTVPISDMLTMVEDHMRVRMPNLLLIPYPSYDQDHEAFYKLGMAIARPHHFSGSVLVYSVNTEQEFQGELYLELTEEEYEKKIESIAAYRTQMTNPEHAVSVESLKIACSAHGRRIFKPYAEPFQVYRYTL